MAMVCDRWLPIAVSNNQFSLPSVPVEYWPSHATSFRRFELACLLEREPSATISHYRERLLYKDSEQAERLWDGLRKAGLPV